MVRTRRQKASRGAGVQSAKARNGQSIVTSDSGTDSPITIYPKSTPRRQQSITSYLITNDKPNSETQAQKMKESQILSQKTPSSEMETTVKNESPKVEKSQTPSEMEETVKSESPKVEKSQTPSEMEATVKSESPKVEKSQTPSELEATINNETLKDNKSCSENWENEPAIASNSKNKENESSNVPEPLITYDLILYEPNYVLTAELCSRVKLLERPSVKKDEPKKRKRKSKGKAGVKEKKKIRRK